MTAEQLARSLRARRYSGYYMARCPVHGAARGDSSPSLSIREGKKGVAINCFAGCEQKAILAALGITWRDLGFDAEPSWRERLRKESIRPAGKRKPLGPQEASYRYTDERGGLVAEKLRFTGKVFLWRRPNGSGWIWKVDRATLPLFLLHEVAKARTVILTEGEKDVLNLRQALKSDAAVTTAPNGANSWRPEYAKWFAGKTVWIIPDSDAPGAEYARLAVKDIGRTARSVRVVSVAPAKDVSDFLEDHTAADLAELMRGARNGNHEHSG